MAAQLESMGRPAEARLLLEESFAAHQRNLGNDDEQTLVAEAYLAVSLAKSELREEARVYFEHAYKVRVVQTLGREHQLTLWTARWLASVE